MIILQINNDLSVLKSPLTSLDPDVFAELGGHAHKKGVPLSCDDFMEVVATASNHLSESSMKETFMAFLFFFRSASYFHSFKCTDT